MRLPILIHTWRLKKQIPLLLIERMDSYDAFYFASVIAFFDSLPGKERTPPYPYKAFTHQSPIQEPLSSGETKKSG